jgi:pimeloyl-ACP methyl ester carboxylesterase
MHEEFDLIAGDGTRLVAWSNGHDEGMPVLVCNGMGVPPEAWPRLLDDSCEFSVVGWNHRGALGSDRPEDPSRIDIEDHADDAIALMDSMGWERAVIVAWSLGVNVAFELAGRHPERVSGLLSVAGVPGGTFDTLFAPQFVPRPLRKPMGVGVATMGKTFGSQLNLLAKAVPTGRPFVEVLRHTGFMLPYAQTDDVVPWVNSMLDQDFNWYFELALALARHEEVDPSFIGCPVTIVSGAIDMLTSQSDVMRYADKIPHAEVHSLPGTHCLPLEFPDDIMEMLRDLYARVAWEESLAEARSQAGIKPSGTEDVPLTNGVPVPEGGVPNLLDEELQEVERPDFLG